MPSLMNEVVNGAALYGKDSLYFSYTVHDVSNLYI